MSPFRLCAHFAASRLNCSLIFDKHLQEVQNTALRFKRRTRGDVAQLGEHHVRNVGVVGSNPIISTMGIQWAQQYAGPILLYCGLTSCKLSS